MESKKHRRVLLALGYYDQHLHQGVANYARQAGWLLDATMAHHGRIPADWQGEGIITLLFAHQKSLRDYIRAAPCPAITLNAGEVPGIAGVRLNHQLAGEQVADYFLKLGLNNLAFFKCSEVTDIHGRIAGFKKQARAAGAGCCVIDWSRRRQDSDSTQEQLFAWLVERIKQLPRPVGIMAQSDKRAPLLLAACEEAGLNVPADVQIVGADNDELACQSCAPALSSLDTNRIRLAWEGAALLDRFMDGKPPAGEPAPINPIGVVTRLSSGRKLTIADPVIAEAMQFIEDRFTTPINAGHLANAMPMSRCSFYAAFKTCTGRSPAQEILRRRIDKACRLLAEGNEKLYTIAQQCGFSSHEHFTRAFTKACRQTPSAYRKMHKTQA